MDHAIAGLLFLVKHGIKSHIYLCGTKEILQNPVKLFHKPHSVYVIFNIQPIFLRFYIRTQTVIITAIVATEKGGYPQC